MSQARTNSLPTPRTRPRIFAMLTIGDLVRRTNVSIRIGRPEGPAVLTRPRLPGRSAKSKWARVEVGIRALEHDDPKARAGVHSSEQILQACEHAGANDVERWVIEHNPPVRRRFLDDPHLCRGFSHDSRSLIRPRIGVHRVLLRLFADDFEREGHIAERRVRVEASLLVRFAHEPLELRL